MKKGSSNEVRQEGVEPSDGFHTIVPRTVPCAGSRHYAYRPREVFMATAPISRPNGAGWLWSWWKDSNPRQSAYKAASLTIWATPAYCPSFRAVNAALCQSFARFRTGGHLRFHFRMSPFFQEQQDSPWCLRPVHAPQSIASIRCLRPVHAPGGSIFAPGLSEGPSSVRSLGFSRLHSVLRYWRVASACRFVRRRVCANGWTRTSDLLGVPMSL